MHLSRAILYVKDFESMVAFYGRLLDREPVEATRTENWVEFAAGGVKLALHAIPPEIAEHIQISSPPLPREDTPLKLLFELNDMAYEHQRLQSLGMRMVERPWGSYDGVDP